MREARNPVAVGAHLRDLHSDLSICSESLVAHFQRHVRYRHECAGTGCFHFCKKILGKWPTHRSAQIVVQFLQRQAGKSIASFINGSLESDIRILYRRRDCRSRGFYVLLNCPIYGSHSKKLVSVPLRPGNSLDLLVEKGGNPLLFGKEILPIVSAEYIHGLQIALLPNPPVNDTKPLNARFALLRDLLNYLRLEFAQTRTGLRRGICRNPDSEESDDLGHERVGRLLFSSCRVPLLVGGGTDEVFVSGISKRRAEHPVRSPSRPRGHRGAAGQEQQQKESG